MQNGEGKRPEQIGASLCTHRTVRVASGKLPILPRRVGPYSTARILICREIHSQQRSMLPSKTIRPAGRCHQSSTDSFQSREQQRCPPTRTARMRPGAASTFKRVLLTPALSNGANGEMASAPYSGELKDRRLDQTLLHRSTTPQSNFHDG
jgi:hypothetical protein